MSSVLRLSRRQFLQQTGVAGGLFFLGCRVGDRGPTGDPSIRFDPNVFISLDGTGRVILVAHRSEMGQGSRTCLPAVLADEMEADWERVELVQADGDEKYGDQNTDGSRSVRRGFRPLREAGATARQMLVTAAAATWGVEAGECEAELHQVHHRSSGRSLGYGELAEAAGQLEAPDPATLRLKDPSEFRYIGTDFPVADLDGYVTGQAVFGMDVEVPDMLYASIERCPAVGGKATAYDREAALAVPGVRQVLELPFAGTSPGFQPLGGIAVLADDTWTALRGRQALAVEWDLGPNASYDSESYRRQLEASAGAPGKVVRQRGDVDAALTGAAQVVEARYYAPHLSQSPMEPPVAVARVSEGRCEVWAPTQAPQGARRELATALGLEPEQVTVHVTLLGGGFGRKSKPDFIVEAALLSREAGRPVKVTWSREDDIRHGYYHSVSAQYLRAGLDGDGNTVGWLHRTAFPSISATFNPAAEGPGQGELGLGFLEMPFDVPNLRLEACDAKAHVRIGWLRAVANVYHAFAIGSFADELAAAAGVDPKEYLLRLLGAPRHLDLAAEGAEYGNYGDPLEVFPVDVGRLRGVVELVAEKAGWGTPLPEGEGRGIAVHRSFLSYVATVVRVSVQDETVRVEEVHTVLDCGTVVNPDRVHAQLEGAVVFGLALALHGEISMAGGAVQQSNFHDYPLLRITETPGHIGTYIVESKEPPAGVGEPGVPPVAPALVNAVHAATGRRIRELPLRRAGLV